MSRTRTRAGNTRSRSASRSQNCRPLARLGAVAAVWLVALAAWSCDLITGPDGTNAFYQLRLIGASLVPGPVPYSQGFLVCEGGAIVLRPNGTFAMIVDYPMPVFLEGTLSSNRQGESRPFTITYPTSDTSTYSMSGMLQGDSLFLDVPIGNGFSVDTVRFTFVQSSTPAVPVTDGIYTLTEVVGAPKTPGGGLVSNDTTIDGIRYVSRILYDTIQFIDGAFIRRSRSSVDSAFLPNRPPIAGGESYALPGLYAGTSKYVLLTLYGYFGTKRDSLDVGAGTLIRSRPNTRTEVFTRQ